MYLRLAILSLDEDSRRPQGIFQAAYCLRDSGDLSHSEADDLRALLRWFDDNLPVPSAEYRRVLSHRAVFWFKPDARECIRNAFAIAQILNAHDRLTEVYKTWGPGSVVYSDKYQIAAVRR